jgi:hypothetical protein
MKITTPSEFREALKNGPFAWPGGYPLFFVCDDGEALSFDAAREHAQTICGAIRTQARDGWRVVAAEINWEDESLCCAHTGQLIECAYPST